MQQILSLLAIFLPLFAGFCLRIRTPYILAVVDYAVDFSVYLILLVMGIGLAHLDNWAGNFVRIAAYAAAMLAGTLAAGIFAAAVLDKILKKNRISAQENTERNSWRTLLSGGLKQTGVVAAGFFIGLLLANPLPDTVIFVLLLLLLFLVGVQLRSNGISLRRIFMNRYGLLLAAVFIPATLLGGLLVGKIGGIPAAQSLALASGFGWYSLSGSMMTQAYGAFWGAVALLNDLGRELFALIFIPALMKKSPSAALTVGGATAMDFTLPAIRRAGGIEAVPHAISFSFIVNLASPLLMMLFSGW